MKYCEKCHLTYDDSANVCVQCGEPLKYAAPTPVDPADHTAEFDPKDISENKVIAMCPYLLGVLGVIIALIAAGQSPYAGFHVKQALKMTIVNVLLSLVAGVLAFTIIVPIAAVICMFIVLVIQIIAFFQVCSGKAKEPAIIKNLTFLK